MPLDVQGCPHRRPVRGPDPGVAECRLLRRIAGVEDPRYCLVGPDLCRACLGSRPPSRARLNPPLASRVHDLAREAIRLGGLPGCDLDRAEDLREWAEGHLALGGPDSSPWPILGTPGGAETGLVWAVGVLTAPRADPTLHRALASLAAAGFDRPHLFAEPGADIPGTFSGLPVTRRGRALGALGNFYAGLLELTVAYPSATAYAVFHDDVIVAAGLRDWCQREFWPGVRAGVVSLYTRGPDRAAPAGWRHRRLGFYRTRGAQALAFRPEAARGFLASRTVQSHVREGGPEARCDAVVGRWALESGLAIAEHTPSPAQHIGGGRGRSGVATRFVADVAEIGRRDPVPAGRRSRVGLIGWNTPSGLGYLNRDLAANLPIGRWYAPPHPAFRPLPDVPGAPACRGDGPDGLRDFLRGLDWLLFCEQPYVPGVVPLARAEGVKIACVPMWESLNVSDEWIRGVDLMLCPTRGCHEWALALRGRLGLRWDVVHLPWPVDVGRFPFRPRSICRRFLFVNGHGGRMVEGPRGRDGRKGAAIVAEAARLAPEVPILVKSQAGHLPAFPPNVEVLRSDADDPADLYRDGDVCIQPSRWEGLGLPLLECQASGLPLVTTDAPPMNEHRPIRALRCARARPARGAAVPAYEVDPTDLAAALRELHGADISAASLAARGFVEADHSWDAARKVLDALLFDA